MQRRREKGAEKMLRRASFVTNAKYGCMTFDSETTRDFNVYAIGVSTFRDAVKVAGDRILISMHLFLYTRSATTNTDNTQNIYEKVPQSILFLPQ